MKYQIEINGIAVEAEFSANAIENIFLPLLGKLTRMQKEKNRRIFVILAAPPGAGKSTMLSFLQYLSEITESLTPITAIGMDGFHHYQDYLLTHTTVRNGEDIQMVKVKGAPETFDLELLMERIRMVASGEECGWPTYNRMKHNPEEDAIQVTGDIVFLEGNYLLLDQPGWADIKKYSDFSIKLTADEELLKNRLIDRKIKSGAFPEEAEKFVEFSDMANVRTCLNHSMDADMELSIVDNDLRLIDESGIFSGKISGSIEYAAKRSGTPDQWPSATSGSAG
jgi:hypothetical protein